MIKLVTLCLSAIFILFIPAMATTTVAPGVNSGGVDVLTLLENGGHSMAFLVAMYWLKDSHTRRVEDAKEYAKEIRELKTGHREEIQRLQDVQKLELIHSQDQLSEMTNKLFEWIKAANEH